MLFAEILINSPYKELIMVERKERRTCKTLSCYESRFSGGKVGVMNWGKVDGDVQFLAHQKDETELTLFHIQSKQRITLVKKGEFEVGEKIM